MNRIISAAALAAGCIVASSLYAQEQVDPIVQEPTATDVQENVEILDQENGVDGLEFNFGGDIRARYEFKDNWPDKGKSTAGGAYEDYLRFRTKVWSEAKVGDIRLFLKLGNEFRGYRNSPNDDKQEFPDELFWDNLYIEWTGDLYGARIGRQDVKLGSGRLFADGTPGDGSRSTFFDAILLTRRFGEESQSKVELFGAWNHYRNELNLGDTEGGIYDMTAIRGGNPYSKMDEAALAAYFTINEYAQIPFEAYWVWKMEEDFYSKEDKYPGRDFHTVGVRIIPKLTDWLSAEVESAYQFGSVDSMTGFESRDISAGMVYVGLTGKASDATLWEPSLTLATLYLSGDEDSYYKTTDGSTDSGWNPVFNRTPWVSEIGLGMYDGARWSNLVYPHAEATVQPAAGHKVTLTCGPMYAAEKDNDASDRYRGLLAKARYNFPLPEVAGIKMNGTILGEVLNYGDYYDAEEDYATFLRLEVTAKF